MQSMQKELELIQELMGELQDKMSYGKEDFEERLGRKKPEIEVMKIEGEMPMGGLEEENSMVDSEGDLELEEGGLPPADMELKKRLMKLRG